jgi:hypothetical protein
LGSKSEMQNDIIRTSKCSTSPPTFIHTLVLLIPLTSPLSSLLPNRYTYLLFLYGTVQCIHTSSAFASHLPSFHESPPSLRLPVHYARGTDPHSSIAIRISLILRSKIITSCRPHRVDHSSDSAAARGVSGVLRD